MLGMLRTQLQKKNAFTPENKPDTGNWYWVDVKSMAEWLGGEEKNVQTVFMEEIFGAYFNLQIACLDMFSSDGNTGEISDHISKGIPVGRPSDIELRNMHATYALTWCVPIVCFFIISLFTILSGIRSRLPLRSCSLPSYGNLGNHYPCFGSRMQILTNVLYIYIDLFGREPMALEYRFYQIDLMLLNLFKLASWSRYQQRHWQHPSWQHLKPRHSSRLASRPLSPSQSLSK